MGLFSYDCKRGFILCHSVFFLIICLIIVIFTSMLAINDSKTKTEQYNEDNTIGSRRIVWAIITLVLWILTELFGLVGAWREDFYLMLIHTVLAVLGAINNLVAAILPFLLNRLIHIFGCLILCALAYIGYEFTREDKISTGSSIPPPIIVVRQPTNSAAMNAQPLIVPQVNSAAINPKPINPPAANA